MKMRIVVLTLLSGILLCLTALSQGQDVKALIENIKKTEDGRKFLQTHSEANLENVILFSRDPIRYFSDIKSLGDCFAYFGICDAHLGKPGEMLKSPFSSLIEHLRTINDQTAPIWTFLVEKGDAFYGEALADYYSRAFGDLPEVMTRALEKDSHWKRVVARMNVGDWAAFKSGLNKLGDSPFESELRQYVSDLEREPFLPDWELEGAYEFAAQQNVLAAVNPKVFFGYWSVCADGQGFGYGYTYPSLDGHQMTDALLWMGRVDVVKANWDYVRSFQRPDGSLPIAILPDLAGKQAGEGDHLARVAANGGLYSHWVPGNPLQALADPTYIQNADDIFRMTLDRKWLETQLPSIDLSADHLASLVTADGRVKGAGYYVEMPARVESDGVAQCYAFDAFRRVAALNRVGGDVAKARRYEALADRIRRFFVERFWVVEKGQFAEYWHPEKGFISSHGLTDVDWAAIALDVATPDQIAILWPKLRNEAGFYYGGMPTGIATRPETYQDWEFTHPRRHDLAAMGRVWYLEAEARARMGDSDGLIKGLQKVAEVGRNNGYYWRERYQPDGKGGVVAAGPNTYCEYPANFIRIVHRFLLGVGMEFDGSVVLAPTVPWDWWLGVFDQSLRYRGRVLDCHMMRDRVTGDYLGDGPQKLGLRLPWASDNVKINVLIDGQPAGSVRERGGFVFITLPATAAKTSCKFEIVRAATN